MALSNGDSPSPRHPPHPPNMKLEEKIARTAHTVLCSGPVVPCIPGLAARRPATDGSASRQPGRQRLALEAGGVPVIPPSSRRELQI